MPESSIKSQSYLSSHPQITKRIITGKSQLSRFKMPQQEYNRIRKQLYEKEEEVYDTLSQRVDKLQHQNTVFKQSLEYFDAQLALQQLHAQLQQIKSQKQSVAQEISNCQAVQQSTTPQQYFLFKKNKRYQTFNESMEELFQEVNRKKQQMKQMLDQIKAETIEVKNQVDRMENYQEEERKSRKMGLLQVGNRRNDYETRSNRSRGERSNRSKGERSIRSREQRSSISRDSGNARQSRVKVLVQSSKSSNLQLTPNFVDTSPDSDSGSSIDYTQLQSLKEQYKSLLQTYEIISQNNEILTTQLFNNITTIEHSLNNYYETQKTKLFRDFTQLKEDLQIMPTEHLIPPSNAELNYEVAPLVMDYRNRLMEITKKLSPQLKAITVEILAPLRWETIDLQEYFQILVPKQGSVPSVSSRKDSLNPIKQSTNQKLLRQTQQQCHRLEQRIKQQDQQINSLQNNLQQIMTETMIYKQKQHELQLAMHNMRKMLKEQQLF